MDPTLEALLDGVIDYAGLFPPAKLEMEPAVREYVAHLDGPESLLVNRFICPAARLAEFGDTLDRLEVDIQFGATVIGTSIDAVSLDKQAIQAFGQRFGEAFEIEGFEVRSGPDVLASLHALRPLAHLDTFLEIPLNGNTNEALHVIADTETVSAKARTGGLDAAAFPSPDTLANFLRECLDLNLAFKLTAGLHHPIRTLDKATGGATHGFLNVLIALALAEAHDLNRSEIANILADEHPRNFVVDGTEVGYMELRADLDDIDGARALFVGFGSCSVKEPVEELKALGVW